MSMMQAMDAIAVRLAGITISNVSSRDGGGGLCVSPMLSILHISL